MAVERRVTRAVRCLAGVLLLAAAAACTELAPTGPEVDPLCGTWLGVMIDPITTITKEESFILTVQAGGVVSGTGYMWHNGGSFYLMVSMFMRGEIYPDGSISGEGRLEYKYVTSTGYFLIRDEGVLYGELDAAAGTGDGYLRFQDGSDYIDFTWTVEKVK